MVTKLAVTNGKRDLLRIIPFKQTGKTVDLKIGLLSNEYRVSFSSLQETEQKTTGSEITYHSAEPSKDLPATVQIKNTEKEGPDQYELNFDKIIDARVDAEFPIPLCKIKLADKPTRTYHEKESHIRLDLRELEKYFPQKITTLELFLSNSKPTDPDPNPEEFIYKWPTISLLYQVSSISYLIEGFKPDPVIMQMMYQSNPKPFWTGLEFEDFSLMAKVYPEFNVNQNEIIFYENKDYVNLLAATPAQLKSPNGKLSRKLPAFKWDLQTQQQQGVFQQEIAEWNLIFEPAWQRIKGSELDHHGVILPQIQ